ncbi:hypothetical protein GBC03_27460 [Citrobacter telavivensis]|nr:hypothetical protein GBC03_27460 [Citrobacter telavivensis]
MFAGKKSAQIREILISESAWEEMTCLFAPSMQKKTDKLLALARISPVYRQLMFHKGTKILFYVPLWNQF